MRVKDVTSDEPGLHATDPVAPGRVAVVTGAASGIGLGLAERFAAVGMHVVMADVEEPALTKAASALADAGASVLPVTTDVASLAAVEALRDSALAAFGAVHVVLCPGAVRTRFGSSSRNRPEWAGPAAPRDAAERASAERFDELAALGASPAEVAGMVVDGIRSGRFYILTSDNRHRSVLRRGAEIVAGGPPTAPVDFV
jgi:short-subunit dehydrogenase